MKSGPMASKRPADFSRQAVTGRMVVASLMLAAMLGLSVRGDAATAQPATTPPSPAVSSLISDLASPDFSVRELAEKKLMDLGPDIEPMLRAALRGKISDEAQARLDDVLGQLDETKALHASVTMHYKNAPLSTILNEFAWQAGSDLGVREPAVTEYAQDRTASIDLDNADFWQALRGQRCRRPAAVDGAVGADACPIRATRHHADQSRRSLCPRNRRPVYRAADDPGNPRDEFQRESTGRKLDPDPVHRRDSRAEAACDRRGQPGLAEGMRR